MRFLLKSLVGIDAIKLPLAVAVGCTGNPPALPSVPLIVILIIFCMAQRGQWLNALSLLVAGIYMVNSAKCCFVPRWES